MDILAKLLALARLKQLSLKMILDFRTFTGHILSVSLFLKFEKNSLNTHTHTEKKLI